MAIFLLLFVLKRHCEVTLLAGRIDTLYVENRLLRLRCVLYNLLQIVDGPYALVVDFLDDESLRNACILELAAADLHHLQTVADIKLLLL